MIRTVEVHHEKKGWKVVDSDWRRELETLIVKLSLREMGCQVTANQAPNHVSSRLSVRWSNHECNFFRPPAQEMSRGLIFPQVIILNCRMTPPFSGITALGPEPALSGDSF